MSKPPGFVLITTSFPSHSDGREAAGGFVYDLALELSSRTLVHVVAPGPERAREHLSSNLRVFRYPAPDRPLSTLRPWHPLEFLRVLRILRGGLAATRDASDDARIGHMLALWVLPPGFWARRIARKKNIDYSIWALGSDIWSLRSLPFVARVMHVVMRDARACYADGVGLAHDAGVIGRRSVTFLPSARATTRVRLTEPRAAPPYRLTYIGRWHVNKGTDILLDALDLLEPEDWHRIQRIDIHGGGPLEDLVRQRVDTLARAGHPVAAHGFLSHEHAEDVLVDTDYLLIPSRIESIPLVFSDAMKLGCSVVSMPVGDLPHLVSNHGVGILSDGVNPQCYTAAIRRALEQSCRELASNSSSLGESFHIRHICNHLMSDICSDSNGREHS